MYETPLESETPRAGSQPAEAQARGRQPFVVPTVEALGGLTTETLLSGSL
jgi:hypothetical protein